MASLSSADWSGLSWSQRPLTTSAGGGRGRVRHQGIATSATGGTRGGELGRGCLGKLFWRGEVDDFTAGGGAVGAVEEGHGLEVVSAADGGLLAAADGFQQEPHGVGEGGGEV